MSKTSRDTLFSLFSRQQNLETYLNINSKIGRLSFKPNLSSILFALLGRGGLDIVRLFTGVFEYVRGGVIEGCTDFDVGRASQMYQVDSTQVSSEIYWHTGSLDLA